MGYHKLKTLKMKDKIFVFLALLFSYSVVFGQNGNYEERIGVGNGLYKVKSHNRWGIVDSNDNLKLSVEYNEPLFMNGKAVITQFGSKQLAGVIDSTGSFTQLPPYYINAAYPFVCDDMLAVRQSDKGRWGFINTTNGEELKVQFKGFKNKNKILKGLGINGKGVKGVFVFDFVAPFIDGIAAVYNSSLGWYHIDKEGNERFKNASMGPVLFRSSIHNGECVIFNDKGIVVCKETPDKYAGVINYLENTFEQKDYSSNLSYPYVIRTNGSRLVLNSKLQADKFENLSRGDSVILIERPKIIPKVEEKTDSFDLTRDIRIELAKKSTSAGAKGSAAIVVNVTNTGEFKSDSLHVSVTAKGAKKEWTGVLNQGSTHQITLYVPAKFSSASISRTVTWIITSGDKETKGEDTVVIRRYKPSRR